MSRFHPQQIEQARRNVARHDPRIPAQLLHVSRVIQWIILRDSRPVTAEPMGKLLAFPVRPTPQPRPANGPFGGDAA